MKRTVLVAIATLAATGIAVVAHGRVAGTTLESLAARADVVAVVRVERYESVGGARMAEARVLRAVRGIPAGARLVYLADKAWTCDASGRTPQHDRQLLFLEHLPTRMRWRVRDRPANLAALARQRFGASVPVFRIVHAGHGAFDIDEQDRVWRTGPTRWPWSGISAPLGRVLASICPKNGCANASARPAASE